MRSLTLAVLAFVLVLPPVAAQETSYAVVTHNNVPVMAGPKRPDAELFKVGSGEVVEYLGEEGEYGRVRYPGGVAAYVAKGRASRPYVELLDNGEARVLVSRLKIRPQPNLDWPAMGSLEPNDRLIVLGEVADGWLKILTPRSQAVYIHRDYLKTGGDQAALATTFANSDKLRREQLLASGSISAATVARLEEVEQVNARLKTAEDAMAKRSEGADTPASLRALEAEYEAIAAAAPEGSLARATAEERLEYLKGRREAAEKFDDARRRIEEIEKDRKVRDARYQEELAGFREKKLKEMAEPKPADSRFLQYGIGELHRVFISSTQRPTYVLSKGREQRYHVVSERYDLSEYHGKTIGITGWETLGTPSGKELQLLEITRMEVLD